MFEQLEVHRADVVLQVEGGGEIRLAARLWAHQHRLVQGVDLLVLAEPVHPLEYLFACLTGVRRCNMENSICLHRS